MRACVLLLMVLATCLLPCAALGEGKAMAQARQRLLALGIKQLYLLLAKLGNGSLLSYRWLDYQHAQ